MANMTIGAHSRLDLDTVTVSPAENANFPATNLNDDRVFKLYKPGSTATSVTITTDAGVGNTANVDYLAIYRHDLFDPASDGLGACDVIFEDSANDSAYNNILTISSVTDNLIIFRTFATVTNRYFRIRITRASTFIPSIGQLQWGQQLDLTVGASTRYDPERERVKGTFQRSQTGNFLGAVDLFTEKSTKIRARLVANTFLRDATVGGWKEFYDNHLTLLKPFFFSWNPGNPGNFEKDTFWAVLDPARVITRPLVTQLDVGFRDLNFTIVGQKE